MPSEKKVFGWAASHACTTSLTSWSEVNRRPLFEWTKQVVVRRGKIQTILRMSHYFKLEFPEPFSSVGSSMWTSSVMQQQNTFWVLGVCFELQNGPVSKHLIVTHTVDCCDSPDNVPLLGLVRSKKLYASVFLRMVGSLTFSCWAIVDVSIPYSAIYSPARNDGSV